MKRTEIKRRPLSTTVLDALEPEAGEYRENYGTDRLYFVVSKSGNKRWELRYKKHDGKWGWHGLGSYRDVSAESARKKAIEINSQLKQGIDPIKQKKDDAAANSEALSFRTIALEWFEQKRKDGRAQKTLVALQAGLENDVFPVVGKRKITEVTRGDCAKIQASIEARKALNTAAKVRSWMNQIYRFAMGHGYCDNNPASYLVDISTPKPAAEQYPHLLEPQIPKFLECLSESKSSLLVQSASWIVVYTASRPGMVRHAEWSEFDLTLKLWSVPAKKMKMKRDHLVPLSTQVIEVLERLKKITGNSRYLFPGQGNTNPIISENTINKCFALVGYKGRMTGHGSRHTATTLLSEHDWPKSWRKVQLAHKKSGLEQIYDKAEHLERRRVMMQWYCDYLDALKLGMTSEMKTSLDNRVRAALIKYPKLKDED